MDKIKVLVVDDESRMRKLVHDFLSRSNYEVIEAADGEEAIDIFYADKSISLIILDVMMPKMDGWEVCRQIRQDLTGANYNADSQRARNGTNLQGFQLWRWMSMLRNRSVQRFSYGPSRSTACAEPTRQIETELL